MAAAGKPEVDRDLRWEACWNVRDLGGYETRSGGTTRRKAIIRAGNLSKLTETGRDALIAYGVRTAIDLRDPREFVIDMNPFHERGPWAGLVRYVNEPLISEAESNAASDPEIQRRPYVATLELSRQNVARVVSAIARAPAGGVVVHCHGGKDRTGVVTAVLLALAGVPDAVIADDYVASDRHLGQLYDAWAAREPDPEKRAMLLLGKCDPALILDALGFLRTSGGVEAYLRDAGMTDPEIRDLRRRIT